MKEYPKIAEAAHFQELINSAQNIAIISHTNPDGDAMGSVTGMKNFLKLMGRKVSVVLPDIFPEYLSFLDNDKSILIYEHNRDDSEKNLQNSDLIIALDFNQLKRADSLEKEVTASTAKKILIDHHPDPQEDIFDLIISDTSVSSTCEIIYRLVKTLNGNDEKIDLSVAESLYVGMMTDTNNFSNSVDSATFAMASDLLYAGVDKESLQHLVFGGFSEKRMRLMGHILLNKMVILEKFNAGYITLTLEEQRIFEFNEGDSEGFVNLPLNIKGVNISALFTEKNEHVRVSLRSVNDFSVNRLARLHFNGGGHERASGGKLFMNIADAGSFFEKSLEMSFNQCVNPNNNK
ncbi:MAG: bifunctional oligoribonuclease/PAP phosphatase NrnA [Bacteroidales bacterium]